MPRILGSIGNHLWDRRRVRKPASSHLVGFLYPRPRGDRGLSPGDRWAGALLFNSGQYNRSVLISAIRVARAGSRFWATPRPRAVTRGVTIMSYAPPPPAVTRGVRAEKLGGVH